MRAARRTAPKRNPPGLVPTTRMAARPSSHLRRNFPPHPSSLELKPLYVGSRRTAKQTDVPPRPSPASALLSGMQPMNSGHAADARSAVVLHSCRASAADVQRTIDQRLAVKTPPPISISAIVVFPRKSSCLNSSIARLRWCWLARPRFWSSQGTILGTVAAAISCDHFSRSAHPRSAGLQSGS